MKKWYIIGITILIVCAFVVKTLYNAGQFKTIVPHSSYSCSKIDGPPGPEDITVDYTTGIAFISATDRRAATAGLPAQGVIYTIDLNTKMPEPSILTTDFKKEFQPHGISLYKNEKGETLLFVINHTKDGHFVEVFEYDKKSLRHRETIAHSLMHSPNDLVAVGPRSFYVTNDHGNTSSWGRTLEEYLQLPRANVVYFDGSDMHIAAKDFKYANGINTSPDGKLLYVASTIGRSLRIFSRDIPTGNLTRKLDIDLKTGADNIERDEEGNLYIACHPKLLDFSAHAKDRKKLSPSQILKISFTDTNRYLINEVYLDDGNEISGSSVAAPYKGTLVIGQVFDGHILLCR